MMKKTLFVFLALAFTFHYASANPIKAFYEDFKINKISFSSDKKIILKTFGKPFKQYKVKYECGFLSEAEQGKPFVSIQYKFVTWTGTEKEGYILDKVKLTPGFKGEITYKNKSITSQTTIAAFSKLTGIHPDNANTITVKHIHNDDSYIFHFENGKLQKIEYWSPC